MNPNKLKEELSVRCYYWARSEFENEIAQGFPSLRLFKMGSAWGCLQLMLKLGKSEQLALAYALLKRFHSTAVQALGEELSNDEKELLESVRQFRGKIVMEREREVESSVGVAYARRQKIKVETCRKFIAMYADKIIETDDDSEETCPRFIIKIDGFFIQTCLDFDCGKSSLEYNHLVYIEGKNEGVDYNGLVSHSLNSWLGISSQTRWSHIKVNEIESVSEGLIVLCNRYFSIMPKLLSNLVRT